MHRVMRLVQSVMVPFLKLFGVEEGHGLSPFASNIEDPSDLIEKITEFFKPPKRDPRDKVPSGSAAEAGQQDYEPEYQNEHDNDDDPAVTGGSGHGEISDAYVEEFVKSMLQLDMEDDDNSGTDDDSVMGKFYDCAKITDFDYDYVTHFICSELDDEISNFVEIETFLKMLQMTML